MALLYAETNGRRARQILGDVAVAAWALAWVVLGTQLHDLVTVLAAPGEGLAAAGASLASGAERIASVLGDTPLIGSGIAAPFAALSGTGQELASVGQATREAAHDLALWLSIVVAGLPILVVAAPYLLRRASWARRATATARLRDQPETVQLLALRAVVTRPLAQILDVSTDPLRDLGEHPHVLAALELRDLGLQPSRDGAP